MAKAIIVLIVFVLMAGLMTGIEAAEHPNIFLNQNEIAAIKAKINAGQEPWKSAYSRIISEANAALSQSALSVVTSGGSSHNYYTMSPYDWSNNMPSPCGKTRCDGQINPKADRSDYEAAIKFGKAVRNLGLGYAFTGDSKYADKAISLFYTWCLDPDTYMIPKSEGIERYITFPGMFYGADLIYNYAGWNPAEKQAFLGWVKTFAEYVANMHHSNNFESWRQVFVASAGALLEDQRLLNNAFDNFKADLTSHIGSKGEMPWELGRTKSLFYSTYALVAMTEVAEIARHQGVDLYSYTVSDRNLELAWDYHVPYVLNPSTWPSNRQQISPYRGENCALYEMAYNQKLKSTYMQVINKYGRPMYENRIMGYLTLTHAYGLDVAPVTATPVITPHSGSYTGSVQVTITSTTSGSDIYYTTNGGTPTTASTRYTVPITLTNDATIKAKAFKSGIEPSSVATANFTVTEDREAPEIVMVSTGDVPDKIVITFNELLDVTTAANIANYSISGLTVFSAALNSESRKVTLTVPVMTESTEYTLTVSGIKDQAVSPNTMGTTSVSFTYYKSYTEDFEGGGRLAWTYNNSSLWSIDSDGADHACHITTTDYANDGDRPGALAILNSFGFTGFELIVNVKSTESSQANGDYCIIFGYVDADNFFYFMANTNPDHNDLFHISDGHRTELGSVGHSLIKDGNYHEVKVRVENKTITIYLDGTEKLSVANLASDLIPVGNVGLGSYNDEAYFDDFSVRPLVEFNTALEPPNNLRVEAVEK